MRNSQISVWNTNFFPRQAIPKILFVLHSRYHWDTPCRVWSDLDNSLTQWNRPIFKIRYLRNSQISVWNTNFFPSQAIPKILFVLHSRYHWDTPCRVWSDLDNSLTQWNRPIFKIRYLRNSQISVWNTNFFPRQAIPKILFVLPSTYPGDTPYRVWFDLNNSLTRWKRPIFKFLIRENRKFPYEKLTFFLDELHQKFFLFYTLHTLGILHTEFNLVWTTHWPDEKDLFSKFVICEIRKFPYEILTFFLGKLYQNFFLFHTLDTIGILHAEFGLIWTTPWPNEIDLFSKFVICEIRKFPYEILTFFLGKLYQKFFLFYTLDTIGILHAEFGLIWTTPWPNEIDLFSKFVICEIRKFPYEILTFFLGKLYQKFFLFYTLHTLGILHTKFGSLWTTLWPNQKDLFLKLVIQNFTEIIRNFRMKS